MSLPLEPDAGRTAMTFDAAYRRTTPSRCTFCGSDSMLRADLLVVKRHWENRPEGQLIVYCDEHWATEGSTWGSGAARPVGSSGTSACPTCHISLPATGCCDDCD